MEARYLLALCLREQDRLDEAHEILTDALEVSPGFLEARVLLTDVHRRRGDHRGRLQQLDALAALDPAGAEWQVQRALAYAETGQHELAVLALGRAAEDHPDEPRVHAALGEVWLEIAARRGDRVAIGNALEALSSIPTATASSHALTLLGRARALSGDPEGARQVLRQATERFPVAPDAFLQLARLEEAAWEWETANRLRRQHRALAGTGALAPAAAVDPDD